MYIPQIGDVRSGSLTPWLCVDDPVPDPCDPDTWQ